MGQDVRGLRSLAGALVLGCVATAAQAECTGSNGRGWGSGKGQGAFEMAPGDAACQISFPNFINDAAKTREPATQLKLTRGPKNGTIGLTAKGPVYTPKAGFKGKDSFCTSNTTPKVPGKTLSGCITVTVK